MKQSPLRSPAYAPLLEPLLDELEPLVDAVVRDVARPGVEAGPATVESRRVVDRLIRRLVRGAALDEAELADLHAEGGRAAAAGEPLQALLDRHLTAGWVVWGAATARGPLDPVAVSALGTALLRAGDASAAALAEGYGEAEGAMAARAASSRREFLDALLELPPGDGPAARRLVARAAHFGFEAAAAYRVVVAGVGRELADEAPEVEALARALVGPVRRAGSPADPVVATKRERLVVVAHAERLGLDVLGRELARLAGGDGWVAVEAGPSAGLVGVGVAYGAAIASLSVAERLGIHARWLRADDLLLERALLADEGLVAAAVERELGSLLGVARIGDALVATLEAYLAAGGSVRATARALGVAPRTVTYRLGRIESLLGGRLAGERLLRLATALFARRTVGGAAGGSVGA